MTSIAIEPPVTAVQEPAVVVRGLTKRYGKLHAVDGLDLDVPAGAVFGLIGPNGAGKTTTMLTLSTLLRPDAGTARIFDRDPVAEPRAVRALVGWMPDFFGLYESLSCLEYLDFFAAAYGLRAPERRRVTADLLELVGLEHKRDTDVAGLSRGMQQRLGLARTLVHDPQLLILDEPASGLDPRARVDLREIVLELARQGKTIIISSHILAELAEMCDRVAIIEAGRMLAQGTPEEIRAASRAGTTVALRVLGGEAARVVAAGIVVAAGGVALRTDAEVIRAELAGGEEECAALLTALIGAGVQVVSFTEEQGGLERLFLSVTKGIVR
jgi:ABC-2 type transport system ATP-binding protein